jgi:hypothetical protein
MKSGLTEHWSLSCQKCEATKGEERKGRSKEANDFASVRHTEKGRKKALKTARMIGQKERKREKGG